MEINFDRSKLKKIDRADSFGSKFRELARDVWHPTKNGNITPFDVIRYCSYSFWVICQLNPEHVYTTKLSYIQRGRGCVYCNKKKIWITDSLEYTHPEIAKRWHPTKNGDLKPTDISKGGHRRVWWQCEEGHEWQAPPHDMKDTTSGCNFCMHRTVSDEGSLATLHDLIANEWDDEKNTGCPEDFHPNSYLVKWWICEKGHSYQKTIRARCLSDTHNLCDQCKLFINKAHPLVLAQWYHPKNKHLDINKVLYTSDEEAHWKCQTCGAVSVSTIRNKMIGRINSCKTNYCNHCLSDNNSFLLNAPQYLIEQYDPENEIKIELLTINSAKKVKWICPKESKHRWICSLNQRTRKHSGCPKCNASGPEQAIWTILTTEGMIFDSEHTFPECKNKYLLPFDFIIYKSGSKDDFILLEFDGRQHFEAIDKFRGEEGLKQTQMNDAIKDKFCKDNGYELIRISYEDDLEQMVMNLIQKIINE